MGVHYDHEVVIEIMLNVMHLDTDPRDLVGTRVQTAPYTRGKLNRPRAYIDIKLPALRVSMLM